MKKKGSRIEVMNGIAEMTGGGLKKKDLMYKDGKIISKKMNKKKIYKQRGGDDDCIDLAYGVYNALHKKNKLSLNKDDHKVLEYITKNKKIGDDVLTGNDRSDFIKYIDQEYIVKSRSELRPKPPEYEKCEEFLSKLKINNTYFYSHYKNEIDNYLRRPYIGDNVVAEKNANRRIWTIGNNDKKLLVRKLIKSNGSSNIYQWTLSPDRYKKLIDGDEIELNGQKYIYTRSMSNLNKIRGIKI